MRDFRIEAREDLRNGSGRYSWLSMAYLVTAGPLTSCYRVIKLLIERPALPTHFPLTAYTASERTNAIYRSKMKGTQR